MEITTVAQVEETLLKIHDLQKFIDSAEAKRDQSINFLRLRIEDAKSACDNETAYAREEIEALKTPLEDYFKQNPPTGKRKSLKFACGSFGYRKASTKFFFDGHELNADNADLLAFAKTSRPEFVKVKESVDWAKLKDTLDFDDENVFFTDTGELFTGVKAQKTFFVKSA